MIHYRCYHKILIALNKHGANCKSAIIAVSAMISTIMQFRLLAAIRLQITPDSWF